MEIHNLQGPSEMNEKRKRGRPPIDPEVKKYMISISLTIKQREKMRILGGSAWIQEQIDKAKQP